MNTALIKYGRPGWGLFDAKYIIGPNDTKVTINDIKNASKLNVRYIEIRANVGRTVSPNPMAIGFSLSPAVKSNGSPESRAVSATSIMLLEIFTDKESYIENTAMITIVISILIIEARTAETPAPIIIPRR